MRRMMPRGLTGLLALLTTVWFLQPAGSASQTPAAQQTRPRYASRIMVYDRQTRASSEVYRGDDVWEAPNWSRDGRFLLVNSGGKLYRIRAEGGKPEPLAVDPSLRCNNDHDFSPDGKRLAISASSPSSRQSQIYVANADGSGHRLVVSAAPSYFHGWSPDGRFLSYVANRDGKQYDVYRVPADGGAEERLTADPAYDDGPDYSPDGKWIYFNSDRGGSWNIWRIPADGGGANDGRAERITNDELEDWFPHPSPDGKTLVFLSFPAGTKGHNERDLRVQIRAIPPPTSAGRSVRPEVLVEFTGGQGTINVNSWSPDSQRFAYVTYEPLKAETSGGGTTQPDVERELAGIEQRLARAWLDGDRAAISGILDPEWQVVDLSGRIRTKAQVLDEMFTSTPRPIAAITIDDVNVRVFGDTGIVTGRTRARGTNGPAVVLRFTDVFVKRGDRWQIIASQGTPVADAAAAPRDPERSDSKSAVSEQRESKGWEANPEIVKQISQKIPHSNFDEARVGAYTLPDPLEVSRGRVRTADDWRKRRAEILELFREHVYGRRPGKPERLEFQVVEEDPRAMDGKATLKRVAVMSRQAGRDHRFEITLFLPNTPPGRVPVFLLLNNRASSDTNVTRQQPSPFWPAEEMIARGYGIAAIQNRDLAPDDKTRFREGIMHLFEENASAPRAGNAWGALAAWGWGASRAMDYFETDPRIDSGKVAVLGHSRGGKAALWAGAEDERFALVVSNESGEGGAALARRNFGETLQRITTTFPHWFAENYKTFAGREETLPVDQHMLIALIAPRAVYVASADEDLWADPRGEFLSLVHASPVYALFGDPAIRVGEMPPLNQPLVVGRRAYHVRPGTHNLTPYDWQRFADFADRLWRN